MALGLDGPVCVAEIDADAWTATRQRLLRAKASHLRVELPGGRLWLLATSPVQGYELLSPVDAIARFGAVLRSLPPRGDARAGKAVVTSSRDWAPRPRPKSGWMVARTSQALPAAIAEHLRGLGVATHLLDAGVLFRLPPGWDERKVRAVLSGDGGAR